MANHFDLVPKSPQVSIASFGDWPQSSLPAAGVLSGSESQGGGVVAAAPEHSRLVHPRHDRRAVSAAADSEEMLLWNIKRDSEI